MFETLMFLFVPISVALAADVPEKIIKKAIENHEKKKMINEMYEEYKKKEKALYEERQRRIDKIDKELGLKEREDK